MPNQRMNSGTQAIEGIARSACMVGSSSWRARVEKPVSAPSAVASTSPSANPAATRQRVAARCRPSSPLRYSSANVAATFEGGGSRRASIQPARAASSQMAATATGSSRARTAG